ncbi:hypothetical protein ACFLRX_06255 [Acidobacteriota bacterium]
MRKDIQQNKKLMGELAIHEKSPSLSTKAGTSDLYLAAECWNLNMSFVEPKYIRIIRSQNDGQDWMASPMITLVPEHGDWTSPRMTQISSEYMGVVFCNGLNSGNHDVGFLWFNSTDLNEHDWNFVALSSNDLLKPTIVSDFNDNPDNPRIYVVFYEIVGFKSHLLCSYSDDIGINWSVPQIVDKFSAPTNPYCSIDYVDDWIFVSYTVKETDGSDGIVVALSDDYGNSWDYHYTIADSSANEWYPQISAFTKKDVFVGYEYHKSDSDRDIHCKFTSNGVDWRNFPLANTGYDERYPSISKFSNKVYISFVRFPSEILVRETIYTDPTRWSSELNIRNGSINQVSNEDPISSVSKLKNGEVQTALSWCEVQDLNSNFDIFFDAEWLSPSASIQAGILLVTPLNDFSTKGLIGGPYNPESQDYILTNTGDAAIDWTAVATEKWVNLSDKGGTLGVDESTLITISIHNSSNSLSVGTYTSLVTFTNTTNGAGNTTRGVSLTVNETGILSIAPGNGMSSAGLVGGPFSPSSLQYTLENTSDVPLGWTASKIETWVDLSETVGTLDPGLTTTVTVSINATANGLVAGSYADTVTFTNTTNGAGNTTRAISLIVENPASLSIIPEEGLTSTGFLGGPFIPSNQVYTLENAGDVSLDWTASKIETWIDLSETGGTLDPGLTTTVTVSINTTANGLVAGLYADTFTFTNTTNGTGNTTRAVSLMVENPASLSIIPTEGLTSTGLVGGPFSPSSQLYTLENTGDVPLDWTAGKVETWVDLTAENGTLAPGAATTVSVSINAMANGLTAGPYADTVTFTNTTNGSGITTRAVLLTVNNQIMYDLTVFTDTSSGQNEGGITSPALGTYSYIAGTSVNIEAIPNSNYRFSNWTGDVSELDRYNSNITILANRNKTITAHFCTECGDANGDASTTPGDAQFAFDLYLEKITNATESQKENADVNCDGTQNDPYITPGDAQAIFMKYLGINDLPCDCSDETRNASIYATVSSAVSRIVQIGEIENRENKEVAIPVIIENPIDLSSFGFDLAFPEELLEFVALERSDALIDFTQVEGNKIAEGLLRFGGYGVRPIELDSSVVLLTIIFKTKTTIRRQISFSIFNRVDDFNYERARNIKLKLEKIKLKKD